MKHIPITEEGLSIVNLAPFEEHLIELGLLDGEVEENSSGIYRWDIPGDSPGNKNGWAAIELDCKGNAIKAIYGDWKNEGETLMWSSQDFDKLPSETKAKIQQKAQERKVQIELERARQQKEAIKELEAMIKGLPSIDGHAYLERKKVLAYGLYQNGDNLVIPLEDKCRKIQTAQNIQPDGSKRLWPGCPKKGAFHLIEGNSDSILIAEGYATAATLHQVTGYTSVMAIDCGNLPGVASTIKELFPESKIAICADNDCYKGKSNPGVEKAQKAAGQVGAKVIVPSFEDTSSEPTDFNDLFCLEGQDEVQRQLKKALSESTVKIPNGFALYDDGLYWLKVSNGEEFPIFVSSPIKVVAQTCDEYDRNWGVIAELKDPKTNTHKIPLPMTLVNSDECIKLLSHRGLSITKAGSSKLNEFLVKSSPDKIIRNVSRLGWHGDVYVLPDDTIGRGEEEVVYQSDGLIPDGFEVNGSLDDWKREVASLCEGNSRLVFAVSTAFASLLMGLTEEESGGFNFRCESSRGKTTMLIVAKSVCGSPKHLPRWRATANGLEGIAATFNHGLLVLDELSQLLEENPKVAAEVVYMLGNGEGKQRANQSGGLATRKSWQLLYLSAGEVSLQGILEQNGYQVRGGQLVRFVDIPADPGQGYGVFDTTHQLSGGNEFSIHLKKQACSYYGSAMRAFLEAIASDKQSVLSELNSRIDEFITELELDNADGQVQRVARRFALVAIAGEIATDKNITGWECGEATRAAKVCYQSWLEDRAGTEPHEETQALEQVKGILQRQADAKFISFNEYHNRQEIYGFRDHGQVGTRDFYVYPEAYRNELCRGLNSKYVTQILSSKGFLRTTPSNNTVLKRVGGQSTRFYQIRASLLADEETDANLNDFSPASESGE